MPEGPQAVKLSGFGKPFLGGSVSKGMVAALLMLALQSQELDAALDAFGADSIEARDVAARNLRSLIRRMGAPAEKELRQRLPGAKAELRARIESELAWMAWHAASYARLRVFERAQMPDIAGRKFMLYNTGDVVCRRPSEFRVVGGWVVGESPDELSLLDLTMEVQTYRRRPREFFDAGRMTPKSLPGCPTPGTWAEAEFRAYARHVGMAPVGDEWERDELAPEPVRMLLCAWWALQRGEDDLAVWLEKRARLLDAEVDTAVLSHLRRLAVLAGARGEPRARLIDRWRRIGAPADHAMARILQEQIDVMPRPLADADLARLPRTEQVEYWVAMLPDAVGRVDYAASGGWATASLTVDGPAARLVQSGWSALPWVIDHLDDVRPVRAILRQDSARGKDEVSPLRVADVCMAVLRGIAGRPEALEQGFMVEYDLPKPRLDRFRKSALSWWAAMEPAGEERFWLSQVEEQPHRAAEALLRINASQYAGRCRELAKKETTIARLLTLDREFLETLVDSEKSIEKVFLLARLLHERFGSEAGIRTLAKRLPETRSTFSGEDRAVIDFLAGSGSKTADDLLVAMMEPSHPWHGSMLCFAARTGSRRVTEKLMERLLTPDPDNRDWLADRAADLLGRPVLADPWPPPEVADAFVTSLLEWWKENRGRVDWEAVRARAEGFRKRGW